jgi:hypothetical protein
VVCADSCKTSLKLHYSGTPITTKYLFGYGSLTLSGPGFQLVRLQVLIALAGVLQPREKIPRFGLIRFRSPLLTESHSLSFPLVTEMFHFTRLRILSDKKQSFLGYPIRKSTSQSPFAARRGISQLSASFIAYWHQGIHHVPL